MTALNLIPNSHRGQPMEVRFEQEITIGSLPGSAEISFIYQPDREIVLPENLSNWVASYAMQEWDSWEDFSSILLKLLYDSLLPKWLEVVLVAEIETGNGMIRQQVKLEKRQPKQ